MQVNGVEIRKRLVDYFEAVGDVLRGDASKARIFSNPADVGGTREEVFAAFLRNHLPAWCNVEKGGFLFNWEGAESGQLDIIISSGYAPKFVPFPEDGKVVREIDGVLGITSVKSTLTPGEMKKALKEFSQVPQMKTGDAHVNPALRNVQMDSFIFLHVYANACDSMEVVFRCIHEFYEENSGVPLNRRPDLIHVNSKGVIVKAKRGTMYGDETLEEGTYYQLDFKTNFFGLAYAIDEIRRRVALLPHVNFQLSDLPTLFINAVEPDEREWKLFEMRRMPPPDMGGQS
jgi:hypothetical protein